MFGVERIGRVPWIGSSLVENAPNCLGLNFSRGTKRMPWKVMPLLPSLRDFLLLSSCGPSLKIVLNLELSWIECDHLASLDGSISSGPPLLFFFVDLLGAFLN